MAGTGNHVKVKILLYALTLVSVVLLVFLLTQIQHSRNNSPSVVFEKGGQDDGLRVAINPGDAFGGDFTMIDHTGREVTQDSWPDNYRLMFFGFSHCPDICIAALIKIEDVLEKMQEKQAAEITPIFITADPERDTPEVITGFLSDFDPAFVGLTGSREQVDHIIDLFRVYARRADPPDSENTENYLIDHSAYIYFLAPDGKVLAIFRESDRVEDIAHDLDALIKRHGS
ncbi:MAG: SCO family protein [Micavibrio sp.]|nr:MAG: SCO family protein [Micavibrio sp.]